MLPRVRLWARTLRLAIILLEKYSVLVRCGTRPIASIHHLRAFKARFVGLVILVGEIGLL